MIKLTCPSCGGMLELPDNLDVAHCMYCGTKIILEQSDMPKEKQALGRYKELCRIALESKNYNDAIKYCNNILEIDPRDVDAWIDKATTTFWLSTGEISRYDEAMGYLKRAAQLAPANKR